MLVLSAREMAGLDEQTIREVGIPGIVLMENAARGAAAFFCEWFRTSWKGGLPWWPEAATMQATVLRWPGFIIPKGRR